MKRFLVIVALSFGLLGCLPPAHAADADGVTASVCKVGTNSQGFVNALGLTEAQAKNLNDICKAEADKAVASALAATAKTHEKLASDTKTLTDAQAKATETVAPPIADEGFGKKFTDGINSVVNSIAGAITSTAKQLNITVNEFIRSPAGILVILFIFAKYFGYTVFKFLTTLFFWFFITRLYVWAIRRSLDYTASFEDRKVLWGLFTYKKKTSATYTKFDAMGESSATIFIVSSICYAIFTIVVMCNII